MAVTQVLELHISCTTASWDMELSPDIQYGCKLPNWYLNHCGKCLTLLKNVFIYFTLINLRGKEGSE